MMSEHTGQAPSGAPPVARPLRSVSIWSLPLSATVRSEDRSILSESEQRRAARLHNDIDRAAFVMSRSAMRLRLARHLGQRPMDVRIVDQPGRKPLIPDLPDGEDVSVSHTSGWAVIGIAEGARIGLDVERVSPADPDLARLICSDREWSALRDLPGHSRDAAFTRLWCCKEAMAKALGFGLTRDLTGLEVSLEPDPQILRCDWTDKAGWRLFRLIVGEGFEAVLAVEDETPGLTISQNVSI